MSLKEFMEIKELYSPMIKELICNITINQLNTIIHEYGMFSQNNFTDDFNAMVDGIIDISPAYNIDARYDQTSSSRPHSDMDKKVKKVKTDDLGKESKKERNEIYFYEKPERNEK